MYIARNSVMQIWDFLTIIYLRIYALQSPDVNVLWIVKNELIDFLLQL